MAWNAANTGSLTRYLGGIQAGGWERGGIEGRGAAGEGGREAGGLGPGTKIEDSSIWAACFLKLADWRAHQPMGSQLTAILKCLVNY